MTVAPGRATLPERRRSGLPRQAVSPALGGEGLPRNWVFTGNVLPVDVTVDQMGRIVLPKALRDRLGLVAGSTVDVSLYGDGLHLAPGGRTARLETRDGQLVAVATTAVTDEDVAALIDAVRR